MRCPNCGADNPDSAVFCSLCLIRFDEHEVPAEETNNAAPDEGPAQAALTEEPDDAAPASESQPGAPSGDDVSPSTDGPVPEAGPGFPSTQQDWGDVTWADGAQGAGPAEPTDWPAVESYKEEAPWFLRPWFAGAVLAIVLLFGVGYWAIGARQASMMREARERAVRPEGIQPYQRVSPPTPQPEPPASTGYVSAPPEIVFTPPNGWSVASIPDGYTLTGAETSGTIQLRFWKRPPGGNYYFVDSSLSANTEIAARRELSDALLRNLYGADVPGSASTSNIRVSDASGVVVETRSTGTDEGGYRKSVALVRGDWTYLVSVAGTRDRKSDLDTALDSLLGSISFK